MTQRKAQERNNNIRQLRGILPRVYSIIPDDVKTHMSKKELDQFEKTAENILEVLDKVKIKHYTCESCSDVSKLRPARSKKFLYCDYCGSFESKLYVVKRSKSLT